MLQDFLLTGETIQDGLDIFRENDEVAPSMSDNLTARVKTLVLPGGTDLWKIALDSKDVNFYGSKNEHYPFRFKVDHEFDIEKIVNAYLVNGAVPLNINDYSASTATEFTNLDKNHAIRADKYESIKGKLKKNDYSIDALQDGIFKINSGLSIDQVIKYDKSKFDSHEKIENLTWDDIEYVHDGWLEHAVGKNGASKGEYLKAAKLLASYALEAEGRNCFDGMDFYVETLERGFMLRPWSVGNSDSDSSASGNNYFDSNGLFLRVQNIATEGDQQNLMPQSIIDYLTHKPINDAKLAAVCLNSANVFLSGTGKTIIIL